MLSTKTAGAIVAPAPEGNVVKEVVKIEIIEPTVCGKRHVLPGDIVQATPQDARLLMALGKAIQAPEVVVPKKKKKRKKKKGSKI